MSLLFLIYLCVCDTAYFQMSNESSRKTYSKVPNGPSESLDEDSDSKPFLYPTSSPIAPSLAIRGRHWVGLLYIAVGILIGLSSMELRRLYRPPTLLTDDDFFQPARNLQLIQRQVVEPLRSGKAITIGITGGSISVARGHVGYGTQLVTWLNRYMPPETGRHSLINVAVGGSESGVSALCLNSMFGYNGTSQLPPIDLLLVEFGYNDASVPRADKTPDHLDETTGPAANYEQIFRSVLAWPAAVMVVEFAAFNSIHNNWWTVPKLSAGGEHYRAAELYGVPVVDVAHLWYTLSGTTIIEKFFPEPDPGWSLFRCLTLPELSSNVFASFNHRNPSYLRRSRASEQLDCFRTHLPDVLDW